MVDFGRLLSGFSRGLERGRRLQERRKEREAQAKEALAESEATLNASVANVQALGLSPEADLIPGLGGGEVTVGEEPNAVQSTSDTEAFRRIVNIDADLRAAGVRQDAITKRVQPLVEHQVFLRDPAYRQLFIRMGGNDAIIPVAVARYKNKDDPFSRQQRMAGVRVKEILSSVPIDPSTRQPDYKQLGAFAQAELLALAPNESLRKFWTGQISASRQDSALKTVLSNAFALGDPGGLSAANREQIINANMRVLIDAGFTTEQARVYSENQMKRLGERNPLLKQANVRMEEDFKKRRDFYLNGKRDGLRIHVIGLFRDVMNGKIPAPNLATGKRIITKNRVENAADFLLEESEEVEFVFDSAKNRQKIIDLLSNRKFKPEIASLSEQLGSPGIQGTEGLPGQNFRQTLQLGKVIAAEQRRLSDSDWRAAVEYYVLSFNPDGTENAAHVAQMKENMFFFHLETLARMKAQSEGRSLTPGGAGIEPDQAIDAAMELFRNKSDKAIESVLQSVGG